MNILEVFARLPAADTFMWLSGLLLLALLLLGAAAWALLATWATLSAWRCRNRRHPRRPVIPPNLLAEHLRRFNRPGR